jgi:SAM-dependent methyltransferase
MAALELQIKETEANEIRAGKLQCRKSGCEFPIIRFVPRFVEMDAYADSFSKQRLYVRRHFRYYEADRSGDELFFPTTGFDPEEIKTGLSLEVGCGYGRFVDVIQRQRGAVIGVDLSTHSIDLAQDFVGLKENVHLVQCDLFHLPFPKAHFDRIYSIGVLHHTPNPKEAFKALVPFLNNRGKISIWVYPPEMKTSSDRWRTATTRMPHNILYGWCILNQFLFSWIRSLPGGWRFNTLIPGCIPKRGRHFWTRVMSDFDDLSPMYASTHTDQEVEEWFRTSGLQAVKALERSTSVTGKRINPEGVSGQT